MHICGQNKFSYRDIISKIYRGGKMKNKFLVLIFIIFLEGIYLGLKFVQIMKIVDRKKLLESTSVYLRKELEYDHSIYMSKKRSSE